MLKRLRELMQTIRFAKKQGVTLQRRLLSFMICLALAAFSVLLLLLSLTGVFSSSENKLHESLNIQLQASKSRVSKNMEQLSAWTTDLSDTLVRQLETQMIIEGLSMEDFNDHPAALLTAQENAFVLIHSTLKLSSCNGAFMILDATTNTAIPESANSRSGLYLRNANVNSDVMFKPYVMYFRGIPDVARKNQIELHNRWNLEFDIERIPYFAETMEQTGLRAVDGYYWTEKLHLQETWEDVMLLCVPLVGSGGDIYGICGIEVSALLFHLTYPIAETEMGEVFTILAPYEDGKLCLDRGLCSGLNGYFPEGYRSLRVESDTLFNTYSSAGISFVGLHAPVSLSGDPKDTQWVVATIMAEDSYEAYSTAERLRYTCIVVGFLVFFILASVVTSYRYVKPITKSLNAMQGKQTAEAVSSGISEIDMLMEFVRSNQSKPGELPPNVRELLDGFAKRAEALTATERSILQYYADGRDVNEVAELAFISINTVRKHNSNIYQKLAVGSRDELVLFIDLFRRCDRLDELIKSTNPNT